MRENLLTLPPKGDALKNTTTKQEEYVDSREGAQLLGVDTGNFFYYVQSGQIAKEPDSPKRNARYSVADILKVKEKLTNKKRTKNITHHIVDWIGVDDVLTSLKLDYRVYGDEVFLADLPYYAERVKRNPHVALAVYDSPKRERILAYISLLPLPEQAIVEVLNGERHETKISTEEIETYERKGGYTLLAESVVTDPDHPELLNTLLRHLTGYWCEQYPDRYVTKIYAQAESKHGDVLIQKLFLAPREDLAPNAYVLNLMRPGASRFVRQFQECIEQKRKSLGMKEPETNSHEEKAYIKTDSKTERKPAKMVDTSRQNGKNPKSPSRSRSRPSQFLDNSEK